MVECGSNVRRGSTGFIGGKWRLETPIGTLQRRYWGVTRRRHYMIKGKSRELHVKEIVRSFRQCREKTHPWWQLVENLENKALCRPSGSRKYRGRVPGLKAGTVVWARSPNQKDVRWRLLEVVLFNHPLPCPETDVWSLWLSSTPDHNQFPVNVNVEKQSRHEKIQSVMGKTRRRESVRDLYLTRPSVTDVMESPSTSGRKCNVYTT